MREKGGGGMGDGREPGSDLDPDQLKIFRIRQSDPDPPQHCFEGKIISVFENINTVCSQI